MKQFSHNQNTDAERCELCMTEEKNHKMYGLNVELTTANT